MQTFLPEPTFSASAAALDDKRLGKQRSETIILLSVLKQGPTKLIQDPKGLLGELKEIKTPWYNHPACKMWLGWEPSLIDYGVIVCIEWMKRGFKDTCCDKILAFADWADEQSPTVTARNERIAADRKEEELVVYPEWYNEPFIQAHRSNLIRKDPKFYKPKWPDVPDDLPYVWPGHV